MPYVNVPNDLSKIKTKIAFNLTKRQLVCFGIGAAVGVPAYLLSRGAIGNTGALFVMLVIMLPAFMMAMYEKDGLPFEKVLRNILNTRFLRPGVRPYTCPACHLCAPLKIAQNVLTDSVIYVTLYTNNRFGYLKEQNSNGKIFSAFTGETGNNP